MKFPKEKNKVHSVSEKKGVRSLTMVAMQRMCNTVQWKDSTTRKKLFKVVNVYGVEFL